MIDTNFIIRYTNGLYSTPPECAPRYDEFRDMFSSGQLRSKEWAVNELKNIDIIGLRSAVIAGAWYGTLGIMLKKQLPDISLTLLDIDPRCEVFLKNITYDYSNVAILTGDMHEYLYTEDIVINTSCEHISDPRAWLNLLSPGTTVLLQSNNYFAGQGHINCVSSIGGFKRQVNLSKVNYEGELETPMYTRYMIIGQV